jgi:hypothetical protein
MILSSVILYSFFPPLSFFFAVLCFSVDYRCCFFFGVLGMHATQECSFFVRFVGLSLLCFVPILCCYCIAALSKFAFCLMNFDSLYCLLSTVLVRTPQSIIHDNMAIRIQMSHDMSCTKMTIYFVRD